MFTLHNYVHSTYIEILTFLEHLKFPESMHPSGDIFSEENEIDDATTPLRTDEFNEYKLNLANTSSVEHEGESPMAIDDDHPHSPYR